MHTNESVWHLVQITGQIPQLLGETLSSNPLLTSDLARTWVRGVLDNDRCITFSILMLSVIKDLVCLCHYVLYLFKIKINMAHDLNVK